MEKLFFAFWSNTYAPKTGFYSLTYFTPDNGYSSEDLQHIEELEIGQMCWPEHGSHYVLRIPNNLKKYLITIKDDFFGKSFSGEFVAISSSDAVLEAKEYYAMELDCTIDDIKVVGLKEIHFL